MKSLPGKDSAGLISVLYERNYFAGSKKHINLPPLQKAEYSNMHYPQNMLVLPEGYMDEIKNKVNKTS